jgi:outer membrane protein
MKIKFLSILIACGFALQQSHAQQNSLTVEQAVGLSLSTHPSLAQARANIRVAESRVSQAGLPLKPEVMAEAGYTRLDPVSEFVLPGLGALPVFTPNNFDAHIGVRSTLYDFGKTAASVEATRARAKSSTDVLELTKTQLAVQTQRVFYAILLIQKSIPVQEEQIAALNEHLRVTQKRMETGSATNFDVLTTQVRIASAENQLVDLKNQLERQEADFRRLLGMTSDAPIRLSGDFLHPAHAGLVIDSLKAAAVQQRLESVMARDAESAAALQKRSVSLGNVPSLKAAVTYGFKNGFEPNFDVLRGNWVATLVVQVPVYDGGRTGYQEEEAEAAMIAEQARRNDVEGQIRSDVEQAAADVRAADAKVQISEVQLAQAHEAVTIARMRYETGSVTNLDLLDAETAETVARHTRLQALYKYVLSTVELDRAEGRRY